MACVMDKVEYKYYYSVHTFGIVVMSCCVGIILGICVEYYVLLSISFDRQCDMTATDRLNLCIILCIAVNII